MTKILKRPLSIFLAVLMIAGIFTALPLTAYAADTITVTITRSDLPADPEKSFTVTRNGVSVTVSAGFISNSDSHDDYCLEGGGSFTTSSGKFTSILVTAEGCYASGTGWSGNGGTQTWSGTPASTVSFSDNFDNWSQIVCTIELPAPSTYTVTWKNWDGTTLKTDTVEESNAPAYTGETPEKAASADKHYTFSGWSDGTNTYTADALPAVTGDVTYTAQFTEDNHAYTLNPTFNWTQTNAPTGDWDCNKLTLSCECGATQDTDVYGISFGGGAKSSAVKCTANANGSYTYSVSKKVGSTTYQDSKTVDANGVVYTANQLKAAAKLGGEWELGNDIAQVTGVSCADGFVLDGNNKTLSAHTSVKTSPMFKSANKTAEYTLKNLTIDGVAGETQSQPAISSATTSTGQTNVINLEGVTITNYDFDAANNGAVLAFGQAEVNLTNCNIDTDSQFDVWGGAASKVNISGGTVGAAYLNGGTSTADLTNGAKVDTIKTATGSTVTAGSADMINPPAGYIVQDNGDGTYSIVVDPDPLALAPIIGFQKKVTGNLSGNDIGTQGVRIITKVEGCDLSQFDEYGYVVAKVHGKEQATANFNHMKAYGGNGEKTIKCNGSVNTIDGYGTSYVTLAVNGMNDGDQVAARFYAIKDGVTYYSNYVSSSRYNGIIATYKEEI